MIHQCITRDVARQLALPERAIVLWLGRVFWSAVPETPIHKECEPHGPENEIRPHDELRDQS
jgi:hypothetical protein